MKACGGACVVSLFVLCPLSPVGHRWRRLSRTLRTPLGRHDSHPAVGALQHPAARSLDGLRRRGAGAPNEDGATDPTSPRTSTSSPSARRRWTSCSRGPGSCSSNGSAAARTCTSAWWALHHIGGDDPAQGKCGDCRAKGPLHRLSNRPSLKRAPPTPSRSPSSCGQVTAVSVRPECSARSAL